MTKLITSQWKQNVINVWWKVKYILPCTL